MAVCITITGCATATGAINATRWGGHAAAEADNVNAAAMARKRLLTVHLTFSFHKRHKDFGPALSQRYLLAKNCLTFGALTPISSRQNACALATSKRACFGAGAATVNTSFGSLGRRAF